MKAKRIETNGSRVLYFFETLIPLLLLWFIMSAIFESKFILFGVTSCAIIAAISVKVLIVGGLKTDNEYYILHINPFRMIVYFFGLVKEIIKSSVDVSKVVLFHRDSINPHIIWFKADYDHPAARALLANSITLTPGTITVDIFDDGVYSVHALTDAAAEGLLEGSMQQRIAKLYDEEIDFKPIKVKLDPALAKREPARVVSKVMSKRKAFRRLERR